MIVTLALPEFLSYVDFQRTQKVQSPHTCFTTNMLQNKELLPLLLKQWYLKIGYTDRTVSFIAFKRKLCLNECKKVRLKGLKHVQASGPKG